MAKYIVVDKKGAYNHSYANLKDAIDCAKLIGGKVLNKENKEIVWQRK